MPKWPIALRCRTLLVARELNAHRRWYVLSFRRSLHPLQLIEGVSQLALDRGFVTENSITIVAQKVTGDGP